MPACCPATEARIVFTPRRWLVDERHDDSAVVTDALVVAIWRQGKPDALLYQSD
jgi:hypothetical protein